MCCGKKRYETRSWKTPYRGDLVIHASKHKATFDEMGNLDTYEFSRSVPYGCALCVVELYACVPTVVYCMGLEVRPPELSLLSSMEEEFGNYSAGRFAWLTRNCRPLKAPMPMRGKQGLWALSEFEEALIQVALLTYAKPSMRDNL